ncbi:hypothetical protein Ade02nite_57660 [Paractinoplanes deccanensis]|uniref:Tetratricopeptide repeat protein n=1 Tax=Paractinoplanes deccanensis TaxID=113561 RepID=A0ABQ3YAZ8_9ACTN|nr:tetratricopeptide repeat protein [Actinoplanes deccanensis]GID77125.1 hypothetical protein Ade02nite_57660 [Actinoplanes deccanensis]
MAAFAELPDPAEAGSLDQLVARLRLLKAWAGDPSYETIKERVNARLPAGEAAGRTTVADCFRAGRRRVNADLVVAVVEALHPDRGYVAQWRQALRVVTGETEAASQVRVRDTLPRDLAEFTGRTAELASLRGPVCTIEGMAGVGKTQLAVHAGHLMARDQPFERVLFVNLRGFHDDPAQPPADPGAVLDGFLRLLGVPGQRIPHDLDGRAALYRRELAGVRALVVLDNAAGAAQVRPLLPGAPGCRTLITSRRRLRGLGATRLTVGVFSTAEAEAFLAKSVPTAPVGPDAGAGARIARRCGHLPLALGLIAAHVRQKPGWTLTDHADRLDQRHRDRRLDGGVELALDLSYRHLPDSERRMLRLAALHPGQDFDAYALAALTGDGLDLARPARLCADHLLEQTAPGRYTFHDLVRAYAAVRADDEERPAERRAALTRLFDHYLTTAAAALATLRLAEGSGQPTLPAAVTPAPDVSRPDDALAWLNTERPTLIAVVAHTAAEGWPRHTVALSRVLLPYLSGGNGADVVTVHAHAYQAGRDAADRAYAVWGMGLGKVRLGRTDQAAELFRRALGLFRRADDPAGEARASHSLGNLEQRLGRYPQAAARYRRSLAMYRRSGDRDGQARELHGLGMIAERTGDCRAALRHYRRALELYRLAGDPSGEADALNGLGDVEAKLGDHVAAGDHLRQALALHRRLGDLACEAEALDSLGLLHTRLGRPGEAATHHREAVRICRDTGDRDGEAWALNGLGEAELAAGRAAEALDRHAAAAAVAAEIGAREQQARADAGLGHAHAALGDTARARHHFDRAVALWSELGVPVSDDVHRARGMTQAV